MKKTYIAPQMETMALQAESMLAASNPTLSIDKVSDTGITDAAGFLSNEKDEWSSESWSSED